MTTEDRDISNEGGAPIDLYEFVRRSTPTISGVEVVNYWRYSSADRDITFDGNVYTGLALSNDGLSQSGEPINDQVSITMPASAAVPQMFTAGPPSDPIQLFIRRTHYGETDAFITWVGNIISVSRASEETTTIICAAVSSTLAVGGLRLRYSKTCPHALYDRDCTINPLDFNVAGLVLGASDALVHVAEFATKPDGWGSGGYVEWVTDDGSAERRSIIAHTGEYVRIIGSAFGVTPGTVMWMFAGCDLTPDTCNNKFSNLANYGGHPYLALTSPFNGDPVF
jgi:uncharacterized phage protein (TIGR02218 family)